MDLEGKVALVTGAARGLGFAIAKELLRSGVKHLVIADLKTSDGTKSSEELNSEFGKGRTIFVACDVGKISEFEAAFAKTEREFNELDVVINNAGISNEQQWELTIDVNLKGVARGIQLGLQYMGKHKGGKGGVIVNIASILGLDYSPWIPTYTATKHGIIGFGKSYGTPYYYEKTGVRVMTVCPGHVDTPIIADVRRFLSDLVDLELVVATSNNYPNQESEDVGRCVVKVIKSQKNGSIWVVEGKEVYEVSIPNHVALRASFKDQL